MHARMTQNDYHEGQQFGVFTFVSLWTKYKAGTKILRKAVFIVIFKDYSHSTERAIQCFQTCMKKLNDVLISDDVDPKSLIVYSDNAGCDQKNRFMMDFFTTFPIPIRYFQRPADHNKWLFDSEGGLFKRSYLSAALNKFNTDLQWGAKDISTRNADKHLRTIRNFMNASPNTDWHQTPFKTYSFKHKMPT